MRTLAALILAFAGLGRRAAAQLPPGLRGPDRAVGHASLYIKEEEGGEPAVPKPVAMKVGRRGAYIPEEDLNAELFSLSWLAHAAGSLDEPRAHRAGEGVMSRLLGLRGGPGFRPAESASALAPGEASELRDAVAQPRAGEVSGAERRPAARAARGGARVQSRKGARAAAAPPAPKRP